MSEKIYACLLRLFPSGFRKHYEEEGLRLLRDRLGDEKGFFSRLHLTFDLITDMIGALPRAYRNSYAEVAAAASLTPHFDGIPSFRALPQEPIRRGAIVIAGILSLTALATFMYVMGRPIPYRPVERNGHMSPIESVIARLNQPISPDSADNARSDAPLPASTGRSIPEARPVSATSAVPAPGARFVAGAASPPAQPGEQNQNASDSDRGTLRTVPAPSSPAPDVPQSVQSKPGTIRIAALSANPSNMHIPADMATNLSGEWTGSLPAVGADADDPQWFRFKQDSTKLTGTGGPDSTQQYPIIDGWVTGDFVRFELNHGQRKFLYALKVEGEGLQGTLSISSANEMRTTTVRLKHVR
jgi:hypothetical protein